MIPHIANLRRDLSCWVEMYAGRLTAPSTMGRIRVSRDGQHTHCHRESRLVWMLDFERRLAALTDQERKLVLLSALGHTQKCIARDIGYSVRSVLRMQNDALEVFLCPQPLRGRLARIYGWSPRPAISRRWFEEPQCCCHLHRLGRIPRKKVTLPKCPKS